MAYNYFPATYQQPVYYPSQAQPTPPNAQPTQMNIGATQPTQNLIWVQGEAGAKSYLVAPNQTVTLWDTESQTVYLKSADASGMPSMKVLDYTIRGMQEVQTIPPQNGFATKDDLDSLREEFSHLKAKFEEREGKK